MRWVHAVALVVVAAAAAGCNSILGIDQATLDPGGSGRLPLTCAAASGDSACATCEKNACCTQITACNADAACVAYANCIAGCAGDTTCATNCATSHPGGTAASDLATCVNSHCNTECASSASCGTPPNVDAGLIQSCVLAMSCDPYPLTSVGACITYDYIDALPYFGCTRTAATCDDVGACIGEQYVDSSQCTGTETGWVCNGNVALRCDSGAPYSVDCAYWGATCAPGTDWPCVMSPGTCPINDSGTHCSGDFRYQCSNGSPRGWSCTSQKGVCYEDTPGDAGCTYTRQTCTSLDVQTCNGTSMTYCNKQGYAYAYDCTAAGGTCLKTATSGFCYAPGCTSSNSCSESCSGSTMTVCVGLAPMQIDCAHYGFSACTMTTDSSGNSHAACVR